MNLWASQWLLDLRGSLETQFLSFKMLLELEMMSKMLLEAASLRETLLKTKILVETQVLSSEVLVMRIERLLVENARNIIANPSSSL